MNQPQIIIFAGTESNYYIRSAGPYRLATELKQFGFDTLVIPNCTMLTKKGYQEIFKKYGSNRLLWVGLSTTFMQSINPIPFDAWSSHSESIADFTLFDYTSGPQSNLSYMKSMKPIYNGFILLEILKLSQQFSPTCKLVLGGANSNFIPHFKHPDLYRISGKAELAAVEFSFNCAKGTYDPTFKPNGSWDDNEFKSSIIDFTTGDHISADEWLPVEVSRGCAFNCAFCVYDRKDHKDSFKNPKVLRDELIRHYENFGVTRFVIGDDLYNDSFHKVEILYDEVWSKLPFKPEIAGYLRLDMLWNRPKQAELLLASGWRYGSFGIETLHDRAGQKVGKGLGSTRIKETIDMLNGIWKDDCIIHALMIAGLPFEPKESIESNANWLYNNDKILSVTYAPLHLTPPDSISKFPVKKINAISKDPYDFGITWPDNVNWVNDQGVSYNWAQEFCISVGNRKNALLFAGYADSRTVGSTHEEMLDYFRNYTPDKRNNIHNRKLKLVTQRLQKFLGP